MTALDESILLGLDKPAPGWEIVGPISIVSGIILIVFRRPLGDFTPISRSDRVNRFMGTLAGLWLIAVGTIFLIMGLFGE